jgi:hypothetical protein
MLRFSGAATAVVAFSVLPAVASAQTALTGSQVITRVNALRSSIGLPAGIQENPDWSSSCSQHNHWMQLNDDVEHDEATDSPGYTADGAWAAANSVLAEGGSWREGNPFADAPQHLIQLLNPNLHTAGASDDYGSSCVTTWPGTGPPGPRIWTVPRRGGKIVPRQNAFEAPYTPQERVGISGEATTGPYLYVWSPDERIAGGSLSGPDGPVAVKAIDNEDVEGAAGPGNGWLLPVRPLKPLTRYRATVVLADGDRRVRYSWTFTTKRNPPPDDHH